MYYGVDAKGLRHVAFQLPISRYTICSKKLLAGDGIWAVGKEILGWIFDGILCTVELHAEKIEKITNKDRRVHYFTNRPIILEALGDVRILLHKSTSRLTYVRELVPDLQAYISFCDVCKCRASGVWIGGKKNIHPVVWHLEWHADI